MTGDLELPIQYPTLPGYVDGIIAWEPMRLQCRECGAIHEQCTRRPGFCIVLAGFKFHLCEGREGIRRCPDCLAAVVAACPSGRCKS